MPADSSLRRRPSVTLTDFTPISRISAELRIESGLSAAVHSFAPSIVPLPPLSALLQHSRAQHRLHSLTAAADH